MSPRKEERKVEKDEDPDRVILCPEEWSDPEHRKVVGEYHKGFSDDISDLDADMKAFEKMWANKGTAKVASEYHKEGAPFMGWSETDGRPLPPSAQTPEDYHKLLKEHGVPDRSSDEATMPINLDRSIDMGTVEVITYALFRAVFGRGVRVPIKKEGMMDMEMIVRGKDVILNTNQFFFVVPELSVWRIIYTHKGVPVMEFGRGVKKGLKVHRVQAVRLALELWKESKKNEREKARLLSAKPESSEEEVTK